MVGTNNSPIESMITNVESTTGIVNLNQKWKYYYNHNGREVIGKQYCSLMVVPKSNSQETKKAMMEQFKNVSSVSKMLIASKLSDTEYSSFYLPVGTYEVCLIPERVTSVSGLRIIDQKPDPNLGGHFSGLKINYSVEVADKAGPYQSTRGIIINKNSGDVSMEDNGVFKVQADMKSGSNHYAVVDFSLPKYADKISQIRNYYIKYEGVGDLVYSAGVISSGASFGNFPSMRYNKSLTKKNEFNELTSDNNTVTLYLQIGRHKFKYYAMDSSNNKSAEKEINVDVSNNSGPEMHFKGNFGKDRVLFMKEYMPLSYYEPEGLDGNNNVFSVENRNSLKSVEYKVFKSEGETMREMNSDITESGDYKAVYYAKDFLGTGAELSFNFSVMKYSNEKSYQLMGNMTPVYLAINSVKANDVVESASHKVMFRDSEGNVSESVSVLPDTEMECNLTVEGDVVVENEPVFKIANIYYDENIQKEFNNEGKFSVSLNDLFTEEGKRLAEKYSVQLENGEENMEMSFDDSKEIVGGSQDYSMMIGNKNIKIIAYSSSGNFNIKKTNIVFSENVSSQAHLDRIRNNKFENYFNASSVFGVKSKSVDYSKVRMENGNFVMEVTGKVEDLFGNMSESEKAQIMLNDKQNHNFSPKIANNMFPTIKMSSISLENVSQNIFSGVDNFEYENVSVSVFGKKMFGRYANNKLSSFTSIVMTDNNLSDLYTNKPVSMEVTFRGVTKSLEMNSSMVSVENINPRIKEYVGRRNFEAMSFGSSVSYEMCELAFKNVSDRVGIKSVTIKDENGKSANLVDSSGKRMSFTNMKNVPEIHMNYTFNKEGENKFTMSVENIVGGKSSKQFSINVNKINHNIIQSPAWGFIKYTNPTDTELKFMVVEKTGQSSVNINNSSTYKMVSEVSVKPGESKMGCLPSRISMRVNNGDIEKIKRCEGIEIYTSFKQGTKQIKEKVTEFNSSQLRPTVEC